MIYLTDSPAVMAGPSINRARLRELIAQRGRSMREVSLSAGLSETGVKDIIKGKSRNPSIATIAGLAAELDVGLDVLLAVEAGDELPEFSLSRGVASPTAGMLPLRREARPGAWLEPDDFELADLPKRAAAPVDPRWPKAEQWLSLVRGDSMNDLRRGEACVGIVDGDLAQVVDAEFIGYQPTTDDIVEVERTRPGDGLSEISLRQVEVTSDGKVLLWSRSSNRRWKEPVEVSSQDDVSTRILGRVIRLLRDL